MTVRPPGPPTPEPSNRDKIKNALDQLLQQKAEEKKLTRADVVAQKARSRQKQRRQLVQIAVLLIVLIASVMFALPRWREPFQAPQGARAEQDMAKAMVFASSLVDAYEARSGRLPGSFSQVGVALPGISYMRTGDSYMLSAFVNGHNLAFKKGDDRNAFLAQH
jgi:hypothetical protein